jgi:lambda repressor-like predicted transcriptional regulator
MEPKRIRIELFERDIQLTQIAKQLGVSSQAVTLIIHRRSVSKRIMQAVADAIEMDKADVFPEYFKKAS